MIKKLKNFIIKLFGIKQCECPSTDEVGQKGLPIINETAKQKKIREKHKKLLNKYKNRPLDKEAVRESYKIFTKPPGPRR